MKRLALLLSIFLIPHMINAKTSDIKYIDMSPQITVNLGKINKYLAVTLQMKRPRKRQH